MQLLLIETNARLRNGYTYFLRQCGWDVDALARAAPVDFLTQPYAAAVVDAAAVVSDGRPLWEALARASKRPVIALALTMDEETELRQSRLPNVEYLIKPFSLLSLLALIERACVGCEVA